MATPVPPALAAVLRGRTTYAMSGEVPVKRRLGFGKLAAGDVVFFGAKGAKSKPTEVDHMGIYAGNGWLVHSSRNGVAVEPLAGWYRERFAWARRPLRWATRREAPAEIIASARNRRWHRACAEGPPC